ncbi:MAG: decaprenyl-phosphate phosphoribosyltransferase [Pelolinea sp.]|nr:decaprenyl-phosphate phosphoribosyltransferase [Pelolinea sp.]
MLKGIIKSFRIKQWVKNSFLFAGIIFDRQLFNSTAFLNTAFGFLIFCTLSSAVYFLNDVFDIEADRMHPTKSSRPIASGKISVITAISIAILLCLLALSSAFYLSKPFFILGTIYFLINILYSKWLKHIPILDVMIIASGFVIRVLAGVSLIKVDRFSPWLYVVTTLLSLFIGFGKRRAELVLLSKDANQHRIVFEGYSLPLLDQLITIVSSITLVSYSLYTFSAPNLPDNHSMMLTIPFVLYGIFRYLYLIQIEQTGGAPEELVLKDRPLRISVLLYGLSVLIIFYLL